MACVAAVPSGRPWQQLSLLARCKLRVCFAAFLSLQSHAWPCAGNVRSARGAIDDAREAALAGRLRWWRFAFACAFAFVIVV